MLWYLDFGLGIRDCSLFKQLALGFPEPGRPGWLAGPYWEDVLGVVLAR